MSQNAVYSSRFLPLFLSLGLCLIWSLLAALFARYVMRETNYGYAARIDCDCDAIPIYVWEEKATYTNNRIISMKFLPNGINFRKAELLWDPHTFNT